MLLFHINAYQTVHALFENEKTRHNIFFNYFLKESVQISVTRVENADVLQDLNPKLPTKSSVLKHQDILSTMTPTWLDLTTSACFWGKQLRRPRRDFLHRKLKMMTMAHYIHPNHLLCGPFHQ